MRFLLLFVIFFIFPLGVWSKYAGHQCKNLKVYLKYLETAKPRTLESHPKCNAFAIHSAKKITTESRILDQPCRACLSKVFWLSFCCIQRLPQLCFLGTFFFREDL